MVQTLKFRPRKKPFLRRKRLLASNFHELFISQFGYRDSELVGQKYRVDPIWA